ncbi:hypothetical protein ACLOJK_014476 [Asimina triloba]
MAPKALSSLFLKSAIASLVMLTGLAAAVEHKVGDDAGWTLPPKSNPSFYDSWASTKKFVVGDTLVFDYRTSVHNVLEVKKEEYDACTQHSPLGMFYNSPTKFELKEPGDYYYYCGVGVHCEGMQKLHITVQPN